jgi:hypothetical protein
MLSKPLPALSITALPLEKQVYKLPWLMKLLWLNKLLWLPLHSKDKEYSIMPHQYQLVHQLIAVISQATLMQMEQYIDNTHHKGRPITPHINLNQFPPMHLQITNHPKHQELENKSNHENRLIIQP